MKYHSFGREKKKGQECLGQSEGEAAMMEFKKYQNFLGLLEEIVR
jgi:hypothetical protein